MKKKVKYLRPFILIKVGFFYMRKLAVWGIQKRGRGCKRVKVTSKNH